jgi:tetratricopeptide (TPR) repeat protein
MTQTLDIGKYKVIASHDTDRLETLLRFHKKGGFLSSGRKPFAQHRLLALAFDLIADQRADLLFTWTAASDSKDAHTVYCFRLSTGELLWRIPGVYGEITLRSSRRLLDVGQPYGIPGAPYLARLTYDGEIVKRYPASCYEYANDAEAALGNKNYQEARQLAKLALKTEISPNTKSKMHRILGTIAEEKGKAQDAIRHYEQALDFNPKAGVKRRLQRLRKQHG